MAKNSNEKNKFDPKKAWFTVCGFPNGENDIPRVCIIGAGIEEKNEKIEITVIVKDLSNLRLKKKSFQTRKTS